MSAFGVSPLSWRGPSGPVFHNQAYDPAQSFAYTSAYSGVRAESAAETPTFDSGPIDGVLTRELVQNGLSDLGWTGDGKKMSYLSLSLSGYGLLDISLLSSYPHLQRVVLASNSLTDVSVLGNLPYLIFLDLSNNKLTRILDFTPPKNLLEVNYSHNEIEEICDLSAHHSLTRLTLDHNQITEINGLSSLSQLTHLSLTDNRLERITNLESLPLKTLSLRCNSIKVIENLSSLTHLQVLDLSGNSISSLNGLEGLPFLFDINLEENEVVDIKEVQHLKELKLLRALNLSNNPIQALADYRPTVLYHLSSLTLLDSRKVDVKEKVSAQNRFAPPPEVIAAQDHRINTVGAVRKPARLRFSTLTRIDEPYPMLVLCGPPGSGKGYFCKLLVEEFPTFFGLGVSHTTSCQKAKESHGRDYYFIDESTFERAAQSGEFVQTVKTERGMYGLTMAAIEQVAQQGLACVTHMSFEGVLSLKNTYFEPRYILTLPLTPQIHEQRLKAEDCYSDEEIKRALQQVQEYKTINLERPGFFDTAINTDSLREGYNHLRGLVMAYGDISPQSPLSMMSSSQPTTQQSSTTVSTSERTTPLLPNDHSDDQSASPFAEGPQSQPAQAHSVPRSWSRSQSRSAPSSRPVSGMDKSRNHTPLLDHGGRRHKLIQAAVAGKVGIPYEDSNGSSSRPDTSTSKREEDTGTHLEEYSDESSEEAELSVSGSSLSKLSSERGFSPTVPATP